LFSIAQDKEGNRSEIREQDSEGNDIKVITISEGKKTVSAATIDLLVELIIDDTNSDLNYANDFLLMYRLYMRPHEFLTRLSKASVFLSLFSNPGSSISHSLTHSLAVFTRLRTRTPRFFV